MGPLKYPLDLQVSKSQCSLLLPLGSANANDRPAWSQTYVIIMMKMKNLQNQMIFQTVKTVIK